MTVPTLKFWGNFISQTCGLRLAILTLMVMLRCVSFKSRAATKSGRGELSDGPGRQNRGP